MSSESFKRIPVLRERCARYDQWGDWTVIKPYYDHAGIQIYHGDCREILPFIGKFDLLLTDPPYGIGEAAGKNGSRGQLATPKDYGNLDWDNAPADSATLNHAIQICSQAVVFGGNYFGLPPSSCWLVWDKDNSGDFADCELAWTNFKKAVRKIKHRWNGMLQEDMANKETRYHPTQKPLVVMSWAIKHASSPQSILDPYMGSGTTLVAAKNLGIRAVGIDREEKYCEVAAMRLAQEILDFGGAA